MTNLDSILKSRDITLSTKVHLVKAMVFPVVMYGCEGWTIKKAERWRIDAFELWCWRRLLRVPWTARRSHQSILKEISPEYSLEGLMLKLRYFGHLMQRTDSFEKTLILGKIEGGRRAGWQRMRWLECITGHTAAAAKLLQSCLTLRPLRWQPTRLPCPWDSLGKNTGVGCHFLLQCMKVKSESEVAQSCPTLHNPMDCSLPGSSIHGIFQARVLEWGAIAFSAMDMSLGKLWELGWTGRPSVLQFMGSQRVRHDLVTEMNWNKLNWSGYSVGLLFMTSLLSFWLVL